MDEERDGGGGVLKAFCPNYCSLSFPILAPLCVSSRPVCLLILPATISTSVSSSLLSFLPFTIPPLRSSSTERVKAKHNAQPWGGGEERMKKIRFYILRRFRNRLLAPDANLILS